MNELEKKIILTIFTIGPTFISKLANRILENQQNVKIAVDKLVVTGILERVENLMVSYKTKDNNVVIKHRNHTYYDLTKAGKKVAKTLPIEENLEIREAFKTYNKSLQNILDNTISETQKTYVINFPYSQETNIKNILQDEFFNLEKEYGTTITLRGVISKEKEQLLSQLTNVVILRS